MSTQRRLDMALDCNAIREMMPDYAFGLLDSDDKRLLEANLANCPDAASDLAEFQRLQDDLRVAVPQKQPPAIVGERLMAAIAAPAVVPLRPRPQRRIHVAWLAAAAAIVVLLLTNFYWLGRVNTLTDQNAALAALATAAPSTSPLVAASSFTLNSTTGLRWVRLPSAKQSDAAAFMMWSADSQIGLLYAHDLPSLVVGKTYKLWLTRGNEFVDAGDFRVDEDGKGALLFHITEPIDEYTWARITDEPTGTVVVTGKISA